MPAEIGKSDKLAAVEAPLQVRYTPWSEYHWQLETQTMIFRQGWDLTRDLGNGTGYSMLQHQQSANKEPNDLTSQLHLVPMDRSRPRAEAAVLLHPEVTRSIVSTIARVAID